MADGISAVLPSFNPLDRGTVMPPSQTVLAATTEFRLYDAQRMQQKLQYLLIQNLGAGTLDIVLNSIADGSMRHVQLTAAGGAMAAIALPVGSWFVQKVSLWSTAGTTFSFLMVTTANNGRTLN